jgi:hypothetical protein
MVLADDRVSLPIAQSLFVGDNQRALVNAFAIGNLPTTVVLAVAFAALFLTTQMLMEVAALTFISD